MGYRSNIVVIVLTLFFGCSGGNPPVREVNALSDSIQIPSASVRMYPTWFWNMPISEDVVYSVGYSETSRFHPEDSEAAAIEDGIRNLAKFVSVHVKAEYKNFKSIGIDVVDMPDQMEFLSPEIEQYIRDHHRILAKFTSPAHTLILLQTGEKGETEPMISEGSVQIPPRPQWVSELPQDPKYIYASGSSNIYLRETESWRLAEANARIALAFAIEARVKGLVAESDLESYSTSIVSTDIQLENVQIVSRWKDLNQKSCHVLVRTRYPYTRERGVHDN